jgi:hypothetical protein
MTPVAALVFIDQNLSIPKPSTIAEAIDNIAHISDLKATGQIDRDWGDNLIADQRAILNALVDEAKLIAADAANADHVIRIEGGLPPLPGCDIIMPELPTGLDVIEADPEPEAIPADQSLTART